MSNDQPPGAPRTVDLHVDPLCPWCWLTALWLYEVEAVRPIAVTTRVFALGMVNDSEDERHRAVYDAAERALRVMVAARRRGGEPAIRRLYRELGDARHERDLPFDDATLRAAVAEAGLPQTLVDEALADATTLEELRAEHEAAVERGAFGVPTISIEGCAPFFGPIVDSRVSGDAAGDLWDVVAPVMVNPCVFELKRTRTGHPQVGRHREAQLAAS